MIGDVKYPEFPPGAIQDPHILPKLRDTNGFVWVAMPVKDPGPHKIYPREAYINDYRLKIGPDLWYISNNVVIHFGGYEMKHNGFLFTNFWYALVHVNRMKALMGG